MSFKQKLNIDNEKLSYELEFLLKRKITSIDIDFIDTGSTGGVFNITIDKQIEFVLKNLEKVKEFENFYNDVLTKYKLDHPIYSGKISLEASTYILLENFKHKKNSDWVFDDYLLSIEWLANKDLKIRKHLNQIRKNEYINERNNTLIKIQEERKSILNKNKNIFKGIDLVDLITFSSQIIESLKNEPLTLVHYDFCRNNILINNGELRVIDWTGSFIGSVVFDLAEILNNTPEDRFRNIMVDKYIELTGYESVSDLVKTARINSRIAQIVWRTKRINRGDDKIDEVIEEIKKAYAEIVELRL